MSGVWLPPGKQRFVDPTTGAPLIGGLVYHYIPGTDTAKDTWSDEAQTVLNNNPIVLDGEGQAIIWGDGLYRQIVTDAAGLITYWDQITGFNSTGASVTFASAAQVLAGVSADTVISPKALADSGVLALPYASAAEVLAGVVANKVISPAALAASGVIPVKASAAEVAALANDTKFITPKALGDSGVLGGGGSSAIVALTQFGFIGDGVTDNAPFWAAMLADASWDMYVPTGIFYVSGSGPTLRDQMRKRFWGPGRFLFDDGYCLPGRYSNIAVAPALWPTQGVTGWFHGETMSVEGEWHVLQAGRVSTTARYFEGATIPHNIWYDVNSGFSGLLAKATTALVIGAGSAVLNSVDGVSVGQVLAVSPYGMDGTVTDTITVDTVTPGTKTITFHPNLTTNYPAASPNPGPGYATFFPGKRTWNGVGYMKVTAQALGGGDVYGQIWRLNQGYVAKAGQSHVFNTGTVGLAGGDLNFSAGSDYTYGTGWENGASDNGNNVAYSAFVDSFGRTKDDAVRGVFWAGHVMQSSGGRPVDTGVVVRGQFRWGLDGVLASFEDSTTLTVAGNVGTATCRVASYGGILIGDTVYMCDGAGTPVEAKVISTINYATGDLTFTTNLGATYPIGSRLWIPKGGGAVNLALGDVAIVFNSTYSNTARSGDVDGIWGPQYGNVTGDLVMRSGNDAIGNFWSVQFNRASPNNGRLRLRPNALQSNVDFACAGNILAGIDMACVKLVLGGAGSGVWIEYGGGFIRGTKNSGAGYTNLV